MSSYLSKLASLSEARNVVASEEAHSPRTMSAQSQRMAALRSAWLAHTIKRAMAAANSASDEDYRAFGWDREELLARLRWLGQEVSGRQVDHSPLTVTMLLPARSPHLAGGH
jgi:hypothetical protein